MEEEIIVPNSEILGVGFSNISKYNLTLDPTSFIKSNSYGMSPFNTTLEVKYVIGGGIDSNTNVDDITIIGKVEYDDTVEYLPIELSLVNTIKNSLRVNNSIPATGGSGQENAMEIKQNAISNFAAQDRVVTREDYISKVLNMPAEFGSISKVTVTSEADLHVNNIKPI